MTRLVHYYSPLNHVLDQAFGALVNGDSPNSAGSIALDVVETPDSYIVKAVVPLSLIHI